MTIKINKSLEQNIVRITFDTYPSDDVTQTMIIYSEYSERVFYIPLGINMSAIKYRYGKYLVEQPPLDLSSLEVGQYLYKVVNDVDVDCECGCVFARGVLMVTEDCKDKPKEVVSYDNPSDNKEYITYKG